MQSAALAWLVYAVTGSPLFLGTLALFQLGPLILLVLPAGVFIDHWPKRKVLIATQTVFLLQAAALSALAFSGHATYQIILPLSAIYGVTQAFDSPGRRAFLMDLVGKDDLTNAVSLSSTVFSVARVVGPSLAALVIAKVGAGWCFMLNAATYLAPIIALLKISVDGCPVPAQPAQKRVGSQVVEGLRYIWRTDTLRVTMAGAMAILIFGMNENVLAPVFADRVLHMGVTGYGTLLSAWGFGALVGALVSTATSHRPGINGRLFVVNGLAIGVIHLLVAWTAAFRASAALWTSTTLLIALGCASILFTNAASSTVQSTADQALRGRVMSAYVLVDMGTMPVGNAFAGAVMSRWGAEAGFLAGGVMSLVVLGAVLLVGPQTESLNGTSTAGQRRS